MPTVLRALADWLVDTLHPVENAPKWGSAIASVVALQLDDIGLHLAGPEKVALGVFLGGLIGKAVQKWFTIARRPSPRLARRRARRQDRPSIDGKACHTRSGHHV